MYLAKELQKLSPECTEQSDDSSLLYDLSSTMAITPKGLVSIKQEGMDHEVEVEMTEPKEDPVGITDTILQKFQVKLDAVE